MEFTKDDITDAIDAILFEMMPDLSNVLTISIFVSKVGRKLISTIDSNELTFDKKMDIISNVGKNVCDELEERTMITFELAQEFREVISNTQEFKGAFGKIATFMNSDIDEKKTMLESFLTKFL
jgi:hypothetical protein